MESEGSYELKEIQNSYLLDISKQLKRIADILERKD
jgi:hypothetical protein